MGVHIVLTFNLGQGWWFFCLLLGVWVVLNQLLEWVEQPRTSVHNEIQELMQIIQPSYLFSHYTALHFKISIPTHIFQSGPPKRETGAATYIMQSSSLEDDCQCDPHSLILYEEAETHLMCQIEIPGLLSFLDIGRHRYCKAFFTSINILYVYSQTYYTTQYTCVHSSSIGSYEKKHCKFVHGQLTGYEVYHVSLTVSR